MPIQPRSQGSLLMQGRYMTNYMTMFFRRGGKNGRHRLEVFSTRQRAVNASNMVIIGRILVFLGLAAILHAGYSAVQCKYTIHLRRATCYYEPFV